MKKNNSHKIIHYSVLLILISSIIVAAYNVQINRSYSENTPPVSPVMSSAPSSAINLVVLSPENKTYQTTRVEINFTVSNLTSQITYALDGRENVTLSGNTTLKSLSDGLHNITVYAFDNASKLGTSKTITFSVETWEPEPIPNLTPEDAIKYFESEGFKVEVKEPKFPQGLLNAGTVIFETKEALSSFGHQLGRTVVYEYINPSTRVFFVEVYHDSPLPKIHYILVQA